MSTVEEYLLTIVSGERVADLDGSVRTAMTETLPDAWSINGRQLDYEPQYVKQLAGNFQKQQHSNDPKCHADKQESDTPESEES